MCEKGLMNTCPLRSAQPLLTHMGMKRKKNRAFWARDRVAG